MSLPAIIMYLVVACIGLPAAFRNPTAAALVMAWVASEAMFLVTGDSLPIEYYPFLDVFVIAVIMAKHEYCNQRPYRGTWHQLKCLLLERSPADRVVLLIFPVMWGLYIAPIHPYYVWHALWLLCIAQFVSAGVEAIWRSRSMPGRITKLHLGDLPDSDRFVEIPVSAQGFGFPLKTNFRTPAFSVSRDTNHSGGIARRFAHIPRVFAWRAIPKVFDAVVSTVAIQVVDVIRPKPVVNGESNSVSLCGVAQDCGLKVAIPTIGSESLLPRPSRIPTAAKPTASEHAAWAGKPEQFAGLRLIAEKLTKRFRGRYFSDSHCAVPSREGQGRAVLDAPFRPAFVSINHPVPQRRDAEAARKLPDNPGHLLVSDRGAGDG